MKPSTISTPADTNKHDVNRPRPRRRPRNRSFEFGTDAQIPTVETGSGTSLTQDWERAAVPAECDSASRVRAVNPTLRTQAPRVKAVNPQPFDEKQTSRTAV